MDGLWWLALPAAAPYGIYYVVRTGYFCSRAWV